MASAYVACMEKYISGFRSTVIHLLYPDIFTDNDLLPHCSVQLHLWLVQMIRLDSLPVFSWIWH
jgi:hypothetical protein